MSLQNNNKVIKMWDIVFINITATLAIQWLPLAASCGASAIMLWILASIMFSIPLGLVSTELATTWPDQGGMYVWVSKAFGKKSGFLVSWFYWVNNMFYCPAALTFVMVIISSLIDPKLMQNKLFICSCVVVSLWIITFINIHSMRAFVKLSDIAGIIGILLPFITIVFLGFASVLYWKRPIATDYSWSNWLPNLGSTSNITAFSILLFSMAGIELTPVMAGETKNPQKTFPQAIFISAAIIASLYIICTVAINFALSPEKIGTVSGISDFVLLLGKELNIPFLGLAIGIMVALGSIGKIGVWIVAPTKMLLESCKNGVLPEWFTKTNSCGMPNRLILTQTLIVTIVVICTSFLPSVNTFFETLALMAVITMFIPYAFMFFAFIKLRKIYPNKVRPYRIPGGNLISNSIFSLGILSVGVAIFLPFIIPPLEIKALNNILLYRIELAAIPFIFAAIGYFIYHLFEKRQKYPRN